MKNAKEKKSFLNSNGLVNGWIPAGEPCPFIEACGGPISERCPTPDKLKEGKFSCGLARGLSLCKRNEAES